MFDDHYIFPWQDELKQEYETEYFETLISDIELEYYKHTCYPPKDEVFNAFKKCSFNDLKVVILGQDPYHGAGQANGLAFSVNNSVAIPPSLRNIFKEINNDLQQVLLPNSGDLSRWASQGVLLLNTTMTVRQGSPNSHSIYDWKKFTDHVIEIISDKKQNVVFLLWGSFAQKKGIKIDRTRHLVLQSGHPSPMSANQGKWFGNKHFSKTNDYLKSNGLTQIEW